MEGFTTALALLDFVPVLFFGAAAVLAGVGLGSPLFMVGGAISFLAGLRKATWKLIVAVKGKDIGWLDKGFVPMQCAGFALMLAAAAVQLWRRGMTAALRLFAMPRLPFFLLYFAFSFLMVRYRKKHFKREDAKSNLVAEIINSLCQLSLLIAVLLAL